MKEHNPNIPKSVLTRSVLWLMSVSACLVVANNYYNQPLLGIIAREFNVAEAVANRVATITLAGYATGLFFLVPLGDMFRKKQIILPNFILIIVSLLGFGFSRNITIMTVCGFFIGLSSVVPQMFVPFVAQISRPEEKNRNIGIVMSGLLTGILGSRIFSGIIGEYLGWREVFYIAAGLMFILLILIYLMLPDISPTFRGTYKALIKSVSSLVKECPELRLAAIRGALSLASFQVFWTTLTFHLEGPPFYAGSDIVGKLSIAGIGGVLAASFIGKIGGRLNKNTLIAFASLIMLISWSFFGFAGLTYSGLIIGIFFIDIGLQSIHITNQTIIFADKPEAANRLNTVYMTCYFAGGASGAFCGGKAWMYFGWTGVVLTGTLFIGVLLLLHLIHIMKIK